MNVLPNILPEWVQWIQALGPLILGVLTLLATGLSLWVSFRQSKISQNQARISGEQAKVAAEKLRFDLYERRLDAFAKFDALLTHISLTPSPDGNELFNYESELRSHRWLFGAEMTERLEAVIRNAFKKRANALRIDAGSAENLEVALDRDEELADWFHKERASLDTMFEPYLRLDRQM